MRGLQQRQNFAKVSGNRCYLSLNVQPLKINIHQSLELSWTETKNKGRGITAGRRGMMTVTDVQLGGAHSLTGAGWIGTGEGSLSILKVIWTCVFQLQVQHACTELWNLHIYVFGYTFFYKQGSGLKEQEKEPFCSQMLTCRSPTNETKGNLKRNNRWWSNLCAVLRRIKCMHIYGLVTELPDGGLLFCIL